MILTALPSAQVFVLPLSRLARSAAFTFPVLFSLSETTASCFACARQESKATRRSSATVRILVTMPWIVVRTEVALIGTKVTRGNVLNPLVTQRADGFLAAGFGLAEDGLCCIRASSSGTVCRTPSRPR